MRKDLTSLKTSLSFFGCFVLLLIVCGALIYRSTAHSMKQQLGNQCLGISTAVATMIEQDIDGYIDLCETLDTESDYYKSTKQKLEAIRYLNDNSIRFLYTEIRVNETEIMFILDGDFEGSEFFAPPGFTIPMTITREKAYGTESAYVGETFTKNAFGHLISAYAPIHDNSGGFVGMVGVDISAEQYDAIMGNQLLMIIISVCIMSLMMLVLGGGLVHLYEQKLRSDEDSLSKSNFLAQMSHEIRTPMNAIAGMTELMLREDLTPTVRERAADIRHASANLLAIINDILDFSKIESGRLEVANSSYQFSSLINDVISVIRMRLVDKPVILAVYTDCNIPSEMIGDEIRLRQIMINVLNNAVKFTAEGHVTIHIDGQAGKNENEIILTIRVSDSGIGIRPEDMDKLFEDFAQMDQRQNRNIEGTGLGLPITKRLCELMGGDITVSSVYGEGSTFTITLPQQYEHNDPFAQVLSPKEKRVLIYETRDIYALCMCQALENLGVPRQVVASHSAFLSELQNSVYTHVFVSSYLCDSAKRIMTRLQLADTTLILLCEYGESQLLPADVNSIIVPAHAGSIAGALNGYIDQQYTESEAKTVHFLAPEARVLIVDDVKTNLRVAEGLLAPFQMILDCAQSGSQAIELIKTNHYDLVLMDHMMPEMDGIEVTDKIRSLGEEDEYFANLPIIALTANAIFGVREMFLRNGMNDYLPKPIKMAKLYSLLEKWIPKEKQQKHVVISTVAHGPTIDIEGIDVKAGLALIGGNPSNYIRILETFYLDCIDKKTQIQEALDAGNPALFTTHVHALKSASASIGAFQLSESAGELNTAGTQGNMQFIADNIEPFLQQLSMIAEAIAESLPRVQGGYAAEDGQELPELLILLQEGLEQINVETIDAALSMLHAGKWTARTQKNLTELNKFILLFEYEKAIELIQEMLGR